MQYTIFVILSSFLFFPLRGKMITYLNPKVQLAILRSGLLGAEVGRVLGGGLVPGFLLFYL